MGRIYINDDWKFATEYSDEMKALSYNDGAMVDVRLPHTCKEVPFHYFDEHEYQMVCGYRKVFFGEENWKGKRVFVTFEGVGHAAEVFLNGEKVGEHFTGYTAFCVELTSYLVYGADNVLTVKVDTRESLNTPPFGFVVDYMTFGGIYRDVYMEVKGQEYIEDVFVRSLFPKGYGDGNVAHATLKSTVCVEGAQAGLTIRQTVLENDEVKTSVDASCTKEETEILLDLPDAKLWSTNNPNRYCLRTELRNGEEVIDSHSVMIGVRGMEHKADGFYLNGTKIKLCGLNRHQSYPYVGYAMPESMQRQDAVILKKELGCNAVRTSHYPQSHYFIDECDRIGLLVFMEFPGWQHIGDADWKNQACENVREMITQYRNHPSIFLWGVRINESQDDDDFYKETNRIAHELDDSRPTGGVRAHKKSSLLEDVYTYNDFVHDGTNQGCEPKKKVTSDMAKTYLISEYNGHMYPTKSYDWEEHRVQHALRHANVLDAVAGQEDIAGSFGWCMFDYNTHKDFGSGDRICYHGVMDMFRNPKLASLMYACRQDDEPVLELSSTMDIGEHPGCNRGFTYIFTNADSVKMYKNDNFIKEYVPADSRYKNLEHGPIIIDDFIGDEISKHEKFTAKQAKLVKDSLNYVATHGYKFPPKIVWKALQCMVVYHMSPNEAVKLYNKYVGDWGGTSTVYRFEAIKDGKVVKTITKCPMKQGHLSGTASHTNLKEGVSYDVAELRIQMLDENNNLLNFYNDPLEIKTEGPIEIIGPSIVGMQGGMTGVYVRTIGESGNAKVIISSMQGQQLAVEFTVEANKSEKK